MASKPNNPLLYWEIAQFSACVSLCYRISDRSNRCHSFCIFQFEDPRDADDAIRGRDGYDFDGHRLRVSCLTPSPPLLVMW